MSAREDKLEMSGLTLSDPARIDLAAARHLAIPTARMESDSASVRSSAIAKQISTLTSTSTLHPPSQTRPGGALAGDDTSSMLPHVRTPALNIAAAASQPRPLKSPSSTTRLSKSRSRASSRAASSNPVNNQACAASGLPSSLSLPPPTARTHSSGRKSLDYLLPCADVSGVKPPPTGMYWSKTPVSGRSYKGMRAHSATVVGSSVWLFGGCDVRGACFKDVYKFDGGKDLNSKRICMCLANELNPSCWQRPVTGQNPSVWEMFHLPPGHTHLRPMIVDCSLSVEERRPTTLMAYAFSTLVSELAI